jgi:hypothetical protein
MTQLNLFDQEPEENRSDDLPPHFKTIGGGNYSDFLQLHRTYENSYVCVSSSEVVNRKRVNKKLIPIYKITISRYKIDSFRSTDDIPTVKRLLYNFDSETKEWAHKNVSNFRVNSLLHNVYDSLNERMNHV